MRYRYLIEKYFLIDEPKLGKLVPFIFNRVQSKYYDEVLVGEYDIENKGLMAAIREIILKARREGFSSLVLALFAADDIIQKNPTESLVISYKDDATETFRKRYRLYILSFFAHALGYTTEQIEKEPSLLDQVAKQCLSVDATDLELKHNKAHFYCGTASARVGGRGGVLQKLLFSEAAFYPDSEKMAAREIIDATLRQVDIASGLVFIESTANGYGNYYELLESAAHRGESRFKSRFYGWPEFYNEDEIKLIASEFTDKAMFRQEYPRTREEAYISSGSSYFDNEAIIEMLKNAVDPITVGDIELVCNHDIPCKYITTCEYKSVSWSDATTGRVKVWEKPKAYHSYTIGADVSEGVEGDYSVARVIDNMTLKTVAKFKANNIPPDEFALIVHALGMWYNYSYIGVEVNKDGLWVNNELFKMGYPNLYYREAMDDITHSVSRKVGFKTDERTRPYILSELRKILSNNSECFNDKEFLEECLVFVRNKVGRPEAMSGKHDDDVISHAIALEIRRNAPEAFQEPKEIPQNSQSYVMQRLERIKSRNNQSDINQEAYL